MEIGAESNGNNTDPIEDRLAEFPRDSKPWLDLIGDGEKAFRSYNEKCDSIDKLYAHLEERARIKVDREFQMFWANLEVIKPSIYTRAPQPVVVPRFKDMRELPRLASELLERSVSSNFDSGNVHDELIMVRDDLAINCRGVAWVRYGAEQGEDGSFVECVHYDHVDRKDFLHEPARKWKEVGWVARRSFLNREKCLERFGDIALKCTYEQHKPEDGASYDAEKKTQVWEIWHKDKRVVVWVSTGVQEVLDVQEPFLTLDGFFPCPKPAYGTVQRGTLIPVPDMLYYRDQLEEINELTGRIAGLGESLRLKGFYSSGDEGVTGAVEKALKSADNSAVLIPVAAHLMSGQSMKDSVLWLPVVEVATTIKELIQLRKEIISDVYQITGISDIMRGDTNASETLGAQQLKSQYGSIRIKERQGEMVRVARDLTRLSVEIMAENFQAGTLVSMSQMQIPTDADVQAKNAAMMQQYQQQAMMAQQQGQQPPPPPQPAQPVTIEKVMQLIRSERVRPFVLDTETDSTIQPDENTEKQRANEFITAMGGFLQQAIPMVMQVPQSAPLATEALKFVASKYRAGRQLEGAIESFAEEVKKIASQPRPNPEAEKMKHEMAIEAGRAQADQVKAQADIQAKQIDLEAKKLDIQLKGIELQAKQAELANGSEGPTPLEAQKTQAEIDKIYAEIEKLRAETSFAPVKHAQEIDHAERQMELAEKPEPVGAE